MSGCEWKKEEEKTMEKTEKVLVTMTADENLERMVEEVNDGFTGGRVTKMQMLSWLVPVFRGRYFRDCIEEIRRAHFDELAHLKSIVREMEQAKKSGKTDLNLQEMLAPVLSQNREQSRRKKAILKGNADQSIESNN